MAEQDFLNKLEEDIAYSKSTQHLVKTETDSLEKLLQENLRFSQAIYADLQKVRRYLFWQKVIAAIWVILIITPIVAAFIYLPPFLGAIFQAYDELLGKSSGALDLLGQLQQIK
jgi:hypothetical protein